MTITGTRELTAAVQQWDEAAWSLAAVALAARADSDPELTAAARQLLAAAGVISEPAAPLPGLLAATPEQTASQAAAPLHQASALASGQAISWNRHSDEALLAQGRASAQAAGPFRQFILPMMGDLAGRLDCPGARMLDTGTGVAALAISFAEAFPQLNVLGIDVFDRALELARQAIAASTVAGRVTVRKQDAAEFSDDAGFDLAWLPAPFIAESALRRALPRITAALHPGGWLLTGHGKYGESPVQDALTRLKTIAYGGTPLTGDGARDLLRAAGLTSVQTVPTPPGAPGLTIGRKAG